jgi:hypothetical protein
MTQFFVTNTLANHQIGLVVCRALHSLGKQSEFELKKLLIPGFAMGQVTPQWDQSIEVLKRVSAIIEKDNVISLSQSLVDHTDIDHATFAKEFMCGLVESNLETIRQGEDPDDLFQAILWLCTLPVGFVARKLDPGNKVLENPWARLEAFGFERLIANEEQWNVFRRWSRALGLSREINDGDCIDLSELVHSAIVDLDFDGSLFDLVKKLEVTIPFLSNQQLREWYSGVTGNTQQWSPIGQQLGWALFTAEQSGIVEFRREDDARVETISLPFDSNGESRLYTHVKKVA